MIAEERWIISSLNLMVVVLLVQPNTLLGILTLLLPGHISLLATVNKDL